MDIHLQQSHLTLQAQFPHYFGVIVTMGIAIPNSGTFAPNFPPGIIHHVTDYLINFGAYFNSMAIIKEVRGFTPVFGKNCYLADNAVVIGDVVLGDDCSVWFSTVLRGDVNSIRIGNRVNIQDGSILHTLYQKSVIDIDDDVTVGHNVVIHGAKIERDCLIGIGSVVLDHVVVGQGSIIAAGSVVLEGTRIEPGSIYAGTPARRIKDVGPVQSKEMIEKIARNYIFYADWYRKK